MAAAKKTSRTTLGMPTKPSTHQINLKIPTLPHGLHTSAVIYKCEGRGSRDITFYVINGVVYSNHWQCLDLAHSASVTDVVRRTYCRLTGVRFLDLKQAVRIAQRARRDELQSEQLRDLRRVAHEFGFELREIVR